jgi:hypothetical protein
MRKALLLTVAILTTLPLRADDGAASIGVGGIILMKREPRIVMAREVLNISDAQVVVDYDFRNDSSADITTEVAFPIPDYVDDPDGPRADLAGFDDFKLFVNGIPTSFKTEVRAFTKRGEITSMLKAYGIDAASFAHEHPGKDGNPVNELRRLSRKQLQELDSLRAIESLDDLEPDWSVRKKYHWFQTFPAHATTHIRHEYTPVLGNSNTIGDPKDMKNRHPDEEYASVCPDKSLQNTLAKIWNQPRSPDDVSPLWISYVDFILTTANTWKTPIEDFTLNVERPHDPKYVFYVSFCWDGPVTRIDADHFTSHVVGLLPKKELRVGYIIGNIQKR